MRFKVIHTYAMGWPTHEELLGGIEAEVTKEICRSEDEILAAASDADAVICVSVGPLQPYTRRVISGLRQCRIIASHGIGYDHIDVAAATEHGICVSNTPDYCLEEVSDHAMTLILCCNRKFWRVLPQARAGKWAHTREGRSLLPPMFRLPGQTLGIIGFGRIARKLAPKAKAFGLRIIAYDPHVARSEAEEFGVELVSLDQLLQESDYVSVHAALTPENRHMMGLDQFKRMKRSAYFINTARGALVDERALFTALSEGYIAGAALDVMETEPPRPDNPLLELENVILSGHTAQYSDESEDELWRQPWEEVARVLQGNWPRAFVNPQVKDNFLAKWGRM